MEKRSGLYRFLEAGWVYDAVQCLAGMNRARRWMAREWWRCAPGDRVVDIGCGTGEILDYLPEGVHYTGFDPNLDYIEKARRRYGERARFEVGVAGDFLEQPPEAMRGADRVLCIGILHHLDDDQARQTLKLARKVLAPGGRMLAIEPVFLTHHAPLSRWFVSRDRGGSVRTEAGWRELVTPLFDRVETRIATGLLRLPYVHILIDGAGPPVTADATPRP